MEAEEDLIENIRKKARDKFGVELPPQRLGSRDIFTVTDIAPLTNLEKKALDFATKAHDGQFRKDGITPYITHPMRVRDRASAHPKFTKEMGAAAFLHDVVEDCNVTVKEIRGQFGDSVAELVDHMTNKSKQTKLSREKRKKLDRERLAKAPQEAKILKLYDRIDNLSDAAAFEGAFRKLYANESLELVKVLRDADSGLADELEKLAKSLLVLDTGCQCDMLGLEDGK